MRAVPGLTVLVASTCLTPRPAAACMCGGPGPLIFPRDGEIDLPTNGVIITRFSHPHGLAEEDSGRAVELTMTSQTDLSGRPWWVSRPVEPLAPHTRYRLAMGRDDSYFSTAEGPDETRPDAVALRAARLSVERVTEEQQDSCAMPWGTTEDDDLRRTFACLEFEPPAEDVVLLAFRFVRAEPAYGDEFDFVAPLDDEAQRWWPNAASTRLCGLRAPPVRPGERWDVIVTSLDAALNAGDSSPVSVEAAECDSYETCDVCARTELAAIPPLGHPGPTYPDASPTMPGGCSIAGGRAAGAWLVALCVLLGAARRKRIRLASWRFRSSSRRGCGRS